jgi:ectoine hydroxylase-related dioxygenase (phytanoyl-CoA dioxygenase family)
VIVVGRLNSEQVRFYRQNGYVLYHKPLFSQEGLARLRTIFERQLAAKGDKLSDELDTPHFREPELLELLLSDEVLDLVEPITGPDIVLWSSHFISKDPYTGRATPWHEDSAFWEGRVSNYDNIVTVWLALDRSTRENGCMRVIPGTHRHGFSRYLDVDTQQNTFGRQIESVEESEAVYFELEPGECSLHDSRIIHGAHANQSPSRRCGYTMRYFPASTRAYTEENLGHSLWLARGQDRAGNTYERAPLNV